MFAFRRVAVAEVLAVLVLWSGVAGLIASLSQSADIELASANALAGQRWSRAFGLVSS